MKCPNCNSVYEIEVEKCSTCGFPFFGTETEKSEFIGQQILKVGDIDDGAKSITTAKTILFIIGGVNIAMSFLQSNPIVIGVMLFIGSSFVLFGFLVPKSPILFVSIALTLLALFYAADIAADPRLFFSRGFAIKVAYMTALVFAIVRIKKAESLKKESEYLGKQ
jgi:hypothetical protein